MGGGGIGVGGVNGGSRRASTHVQELKVVVDDGVGGDGVGVRINMYSTKTKIHRISSPSSSTITLFTSITMFLLGLTIFYKIFH